MLAPSKIPQIENLVYPLLVQPKLDGFRCVYVDGQLLSRTGKPMGNSSLAGHFNTKNFPKDKIIDGELYMHGLPFPKLSSILRKDKADIPEGLRFNAYDTMSLEEWNKRQCKGIYSDRIRWVRELINDKIANYKKVIDTPTDLCNTPSEVMSLYNKYLAKGYEGVMLKDPNGLYKWKRVTMNSGEMLKLKPFKSIDLPIKEIYDGEKSFTGMAGGVVCTYNDHTIRIGSGFNVATRKAMAKSPNEFIGKTIEIQYFEETEEGALRFPTFERFRPDKDKQ